MDIMHWIERVLFRPSPRAAWAREAYDEAGLRGIDPAAPAHDAVRRTDLLPLLNCSGIDMVVQFPRHRRADAVAYAREIAAFQAGIHAAASGDRRN